MSRYKQKNPVLFYRKAVYRFATSCQQPGEKSQYILVSSFPTIRRLVTDHLVLYVERFV